MILEQINEEVKDQDTQNPSTSCYTLFKRYPILRKETLGYPSTHPTLFVTP